MYDFPLVAHGMNIHFPKPTGTWDSEHPYPSHVPYLPKAITGTWDSEHPYPSHVPYLPKAITG